MHVVLMSLEAGHCGGNVQETKFDWNLHPFPPLPPLFAPSQSLFSNLSKALSGTEEARILMVGLDAAGKVSQLRLEPSCSHCPETS